MNRFYSFIRKPYLYAITFGIILFSLAAYTLLDAFLIPHQITSGYSGTSGFSDSTTNSLAGTTEQNTSQVITDTSYEDSNIRISITTKRTNNTNVYIAEIWLSDAGYLKTALANNRFGTNITAKTSQTAAANQAILAINGDYYGANKTGYVIKNGILLRNTIRGDSEYDDLAILPDGNFQILNEKNVSASELQTQGISQLFAFGPTLIQNQTIAINKNTEVDQSMTSNPRTAIGIIEPLHYVFVVSDGRTSESTGLSLYQLADLMSDYECQTAYNLDGGGSSTMYFNGNIINKPTTNGKSIQERAVSDIVYIGY